MRDTIGTLALALGASFACIVFGNDKAQLVGWIIFWAVGAVGFFIGGFYYLEGRWHNHVWTQWERDGDVIRKYASGNVAVVGFTQIRRCAECGFTQTNRQDTI